MTEEQLPEALVLASEEPKKEGKQVQGSNLSGKHGSGDRTKLWETFSPLSSLPGNSLIAKAGRAFHAAMPFKACAKNEL